MPIAKSIPCHHQAPSVPQSRLLRSASLPRTAKNKELQFAAGSTYGVSLQQPMSTRSCLLYRYQRSDRSARQVWKFELGALGVVGIEFCFE